MPLLIYRAAATILLTIFEILRADDDLIPYNWLLYQLLVSAKGHEVQLQHSNIKQQILPNCNLQMRGFFFLVFVPPEVCKLNTRGKKEKGKKH